MTVVAGHRFTTSRSRLPIEWRDLNGRPLFFTIAVMHTPSKLPHSHTCFFKVNAPACVFLGSCLTGARVTTAVGPAAVRLRPSHA